MSLTMTTTATLISNPDQEKFAAMKTAIEEIFSKVSEATNNVYPSQRAISKSPEGSLASWLWQHQPAERFVAYVDDKIVGYVEVETVDNCTDKNEIYTSGLKAYWQRVLFSQKNFQKKHLKPCRAKIIRRLVVDPDYQHQGIGRQLLEEAISAVKNQKSYAVAVIADNNPYSKKVFLKAGFEPINNTVGVTGDRLTSFLKV